MDTMKELTGETDKEYNKRLNVKSEEKDGCCWDEEKQEWYGLTPISVNKSKCLGCNKTIRLDLTR